MTAPAQTSTSTGPFMKGSIIWQKKGPLPVWAWALILLGVVLAVSLWRSNRAGGEANEAATGYTDELPGDQTAPPVFIVPQAATPQVIVNNVPATVPTAPPGGGREAPPGTPKPAPPPAVKKEKVTVTKYTSKNPPWSSTISGIFSHFKGKTTATNWQAIWNHPLNSDIKRRRGAADKIQPGDIIWVPVK